MSAATRPDPRAATAALLALAAAGAAARPAGAQSAPPAPAVIHACYVPLSGTVYRVKAPGTAQQCLQPSHVAFSWTDGAASAGGPAPAAHAQLSGLAADDHPQYLLAQGVRASANGFAVTGVVGQGSVPTTGDGVRLMWYAGKAALRAGRTVGGGWDETNVGVYSTAFGDQTRASYPASTALGFGTWAAGFAALAAGDRAVAVADGAVALGRQAAAQARGAVAVGEHAFADGGSAIALGYGAEAGGNEAVALGKSIAGGFRAVAMGSETVASGKGALATGYRTVASGEGSTAMGHHASTNFKRGAFVYADASTDDPVTAQIDNHFVVRAQRVWLGSTGNATATYGRFLETNTGAYLTSGGAWTNSSDSTKKHRWAAVRGEGVLARLAAVPIRTWSYRAEGDSVRHMGPTAQAFRRAFGLGDTDRAIATVDADGVALAAAQALERRTRRLGRRADSLAAELRALQAERAAERAATVARLDRMERSLAAAVARAAAAPAVPVRAARRTPPSARVAFPPPRPLPALALAPR